MTCDSVDYGSLVWSDDLILGIDRIDEQHRQWIALVQAYQSAVVNGGSAEEIQRTLSAAAAYTESHFEDEQAVMEEAGYPFIDDHLAQHRLAWRRVNGFGADGPAEDGEGNEALRDSLADFLPQWLMLHINTADRQFARWYRSQAATEAATEQPPAPCAPAAIDDGRVFADIPL
jgi:hemerythrin